MPICVSNLRRAGFLAAVSLLVAGCGSGAEAEMDAKLAAAQAAANRAEKAAEAAASSAAAASARSSVETVFAEPEPPSMDEPDSVPDEGAPSNVIADSPTSPPA